MSSSLAQPLRDLSNASTNTMLTAMVKTFPPDLPRLGVDLRAHKLIIGIQWGAIVFSSGIAPLLGYYLLHYLDPAETFTTQISPWLALMGATTVFGLLTRTWFLCKKSTTSLPLGQRSRWGMDFFGWNYWFGFVALTALISIGIALESLVVVSLPMSVLVLYVCLELVLVEVLMACGVRAPFRLSSVARGDLLRPGTYMIAEDVVAVEGKQGQAFRRAIQERYDASPVFRAHLRKLDWMWGVTGLCVIAAVFAVVLAVDNKNIGYGIGWGVPWIWAGSMSVITVYMGRSMLRKEAVMRQRTGD